MNLLHFFCLIKHLVKFWVRQILYMVKSMSYKGLVEQFSLILVFFKNNTFHQIFLNIFSLKVSLLLSLLLDNPKMHL
jgi:hypothetical protein